MVFSSMVFIWGFLPILLIFYFISPKKIRNYILLVFSLLFYAWGEPKYIILMLVSILANYLFGLLIARKRPRKKDYQRKIVLVLSILFNLGLLGFFKYSNFFIDNLNNVFGLSIHTLNVALPIGISFYTFQIMSYVIDLYRKEIKVQKNILNLALYISFFPQLIAGPIVKYRDIEKQLKSRTITVEKFAYGIKRFIYGLGKKVILANNLALIADLIFDSGANTITTPYAWLGIIAYSLQIFFDFSGYSDMAIGLGSMFGFTFMENFNLPYLSSSITEFWRRWHISLSTWFKEYLYIPLGGNRKGKKRTYLNLWIVFLATGIWHGAAWTFVIWGILHGLFIFIERLGFKKFLDNHKIIGHIYTLFAVLIGWVFFRAETIGEAMTYLATMFGFTNNVLIFNPVRISNIKTPIIILLAILLSGILQVVIKKLCEKKKIEDSFLKVKKYSEPLLFVAILGLSIMILISNTYNPFIYFRF